ncbi:MAG: hypothetical protein ACLTX3_06780 [Lachnospiraceae bacterium]
MAEILHTPSAHDNIAKIISQPLGALLSASIDKEGHPIADVKKYFSSNVLVF